MSANNSTKLKILFLSKSTPIYGGVERWLADLALGLEAIGHECLVALAQGALFHDARKYHKAYPDLRVVTLNGETGSPIGRQMAIKETLYQYTPDIVIPVSLGDGLAVSAYLKAKLRYKLVYPVHEVGEGVINDLKGYARYIDSIVFVDKSSEHYYQPYLSQNNHTQLIPCGVLARQTSDKVETNTLKLGHCGRIAKGKRALDLIPLCDALDNKDQQYALSIVGEGHQLDTLRTGFESRLDRHGNGSVVIHQPIDRDQLYEEFYNHIDCLIITSEGETGPLVAFEAMMNKVIVVTSDFRGRSENECLINGHNCLVFPVGDVSMAADHIKSLTSDPELKKRIISTAYEYVSTKRTLGLMCESWHQLFLSLLTQEQTISQSYAKHDFSEIQLNSISQRIKEPIKRVLGIKYLHQYAGAEWPFFNPAKDA